MVVKTSGNARPSVLKKNIPWAVLPDWSPTGEWITYRDKNIADVLAMSVDDGGSIQTYCIDIHNPTQDSAKYQEVSWGASSLGANPDAGKIKWILQNSYPQVNDLNALAKKAGAASLSPQLAALDLIRSVAARQAI